jgi:hypothetical protein
MIPSPRERPTEYAVALAAAALALVAVFVRLPPGFEAAALAFVGVLAPLVTIIAQRIGARASPLSVPPAPIATVELPPDDDDAA